MAIVTVAWASSLVYDLNIATTGSKTRVGALMNTTSQISQHLSLLIRQDSSVSSFERGFVTAVAAIHVDVKSIINEFHSVDP